MSAMPSGDRYSSRTVSDAEVPRHLRPAYLGLLLSRAHPPNEVAWPTGIADYVLCGVPIMISSGVGDSSSVVAEYKIGVVLERPDPHEVSKGLERVATEPTHTRLVRIARFGDRFFHERVAPKMAGLHYQPAED